MMGMSDKDRVFLGHTRDGVVGGPGEGMVGG